MAENRVEEDKKTPQKELSYAEKISSWAMGFATGLLFLINQGAIDNIMDPNRKYKKKKQTPQ